MDASPNLLSSKGIDDFNGKEIKKKPTQIFKVSKFKETNYLYFSY